MQKLGLIIRREYLTRVKRRSFILATLLTPLAFALFFIVVGFIFQYESDDTNRVAIIDEGNILDGAIKDEKNLYFKFVKEDLNAFREGFEDTDFDGILVIPPVENMLEKRHRIYYYADKQLTLDLEMVISDRIASAIRDYKIDALQLERQQLDALDVRVELEPEPLSDNGKDVSQYRSAIAAAIGGIMGFIMYMTVFIYGMMIMRSVMEEKTNRIVEVMISSVRPFQLMLGKIIGVGGVGLTQVAVWSIMIPLLMLLVQLVFGFDPADQVPAAQAAQGIEIDPDDTQTMVALVINEINSLNWWVILPLFIFYFLGGFFLYSSLFAAVGSAIGDDTGEGQSLTIPITIPVILALYVMIAALQSPNSSLAVGGSLFPLFSPIVMPARLAFEPPGWEIALSMLLLAATSVFLIWLSGRIYRVGILMYGKKVGFKELGKWLFYKE